MSTYQNVAMLRHAIDQWNQADYEGYLSLYDERAVLSDCPGVEPGKGGIRKFYEGIWAGFPASRIEVDETFACEDRVVCRFRLSGSHGGPFAGMPASGRPFTIAGITILRFEHGRCVERWSQADFLGLMAQIGALPAPGPG